MADDSDTADWITEALPPVRLSLQDLSEVLDAVGATKLELEGEGVVTMEQLAALDRPQITDLHIEGNSIELDLASSCVIVAFSPSVRERAAAAIDVLRKSRPPLWWSTHSDFAIVFGMLVPLLAGLLAPSSPKLWAGLAALAWLGYLLWVHRNCQLRWSTIVVVS